MAIGQCRDCRHKVSTAALTCPSCGCPGPHPERKWWRLGPRPRTSKSAIFAVIFFVLVILFMLAATWVLRVMRMNDVLY